MQIKKLKESFKILLLLPFVCLFTFPQKTYSQLSIRGPVSVSVTKVTDRSGAPWWKERFEEKLKTILSTELSSAGHFLVIERDDEALADMEKERLLSSNNKSDEPFANQIAQPQYIIRAYLSDYEDSYVSFDLKVINRKTSVIAYSRSIEGRINNKIKKESVAVRANNFSYKETTQTAKRVVPSRAIRAAINEIAEYLDCVLYLKDECLGEYEAKEERRKRSNDALDMF